MIAKIITNFYHNLSNFKDFYSYEKNYFTPNLIQTINQSNSTYYIIILLQIIRKKILKYLNNYLVLL